MTRKTLKKILVGTISNFLILVLILGIHIYVVTRPKVDKQTRVMARIDIKDPIDNQDAQNITSWLYQQKGVDHVLVNPKTGIAIFTYSPLVTNGDSIANSFTTSFHYVARRYIPSQAELQSSCPVASNSFSYKVYSYISHIF